MDDYYFLDAVERYLRDEMNPEERLRFEQLRNQNPEIDMMVVEHKLFLQQMESFAGYRELKHHLNEVHANLQASGHINPAVHAPGKMVSIWKKYKRTITIAASFSGITALIISLLVTSLSPAVDKNKLQQLSKDIETIKKTQVYQNHTINQVRAEVRSKIPENAILTGGGTAFLIDTKGYLATNAHVLKGKNAVVSDFNGREFSATITFIDHTRDLAILKITDSDFNMPKNLPYKLSKEPSDLGEELFTLGYPKNNEIVYNRGYLSAQTGFDSDTISCQISLPANPGNSGGPVFNSNGEVIGILSAREIQAQGVVFAVKTRELIKMIEELKSSDSSFQKISLSAGGNIKSLPRTKQIEKVQPYVYQVKAYDTN